MSCDAKKISEKYEDFLGEGHYFIPGAKELLEDYCQKNIICIWHRTEP